VFLFSARPGCPNTYPAAGYWLGPAESCGASSRRGTFSGGDLAEYVAAWQQPGALRGMVNWYRAAARQARRLASPGRVTGPLHIIWGRKDAFLEADMARQSLAYCDQGQLTYVEASHWVQHEEPKLVNELLLRFLE
jgi:pimeloyl-ACP methyl ester carboxylesterase